MTALLKDKWEERLQNAKASMRAAILLAETALNYVDGEWGTVRQFRSICNRILREQRQLLKEIDKWEYKK